MFTLGLVWISAHYGIGYPLLLYIVVVVLDLCMLDSISSIFRNNDDNDRTGG
jgi:hypothetical protein